MEIILLVLWTVGVFALGVWKGNDVKKIFRARQSRQELVITGVDKPQNQFTDTYTVDELESHKRYLEKEIKRHVHYPYLRQSYVHDLKEVLKTLEWHYDTDGTREHRAQKERVRQDLKNFDEMYNAALKGVGG